MITKSKAKTKPRIKRTVKPKQTKPEPIPEPVVEVKPVRVMSAVERRRRLLIEGEITSVADSRKKIHIP